MKNLSLWIGGFLVILNIIIGLLVPAYITNNIIINTIVIVTTSMLCYFAATITIADAFKIFLSLFFAVMGVTEYILGFKVSEQLVGDGHFVAMVILLAIQILTIFVIYAFNRTNDNAKPHR